MSLKVSYVTANKLAFCLWNLNFRKVKADDLNGAKMRQFLEEDRKI